VTADYVSLCLFVKRITQNLRGIFVKFGNELTMDQRIDYFLEC